MKAKIIILILILTLIGLGGHTLHKNKRRITHETRKAYRFILQT